MSKFLDENLNEDELNYVKEVGSLFADELDKLPIEEAVSVSVIMPTALNCYVGIDDNANATGYDKLKGYAWAFVSTNPDITNNMKAFEASTTCGLQMVCFDKANKKYGYLVFMKISRLIKVINDAIKDPAYKIDDTMLLDAKKHHDEALHSLYEKMVSGKFTKINQNGSAKIGIFCNNKTSSVVIKGVTIDAFSITFDELLDLCEHCGYGVVLDNDVYPSTSLRGIRDKVLRNLEVSPGNNSLFVDIAKI